MSEAEMKTEETATYAKILGLELILLGMLGASFFSRAIGFLYWPALTGLGLYATSERQRIDRLKAEYQAELDAAFTCPLGMDEVSCFGARCPNLKTCSRLSYLVVYGGRETQINTSRTGR